MRPPTCPSAARLETSALPPSITAPARSSARCPRARYSARSSSWPSASSSSRRPYFVPDNAVASALQAAAWRGVDVTLNLPEVNDSWVVKCASRGHYQALLEAGVRIMEHGPGLLHAKLATIDGEIALIGSSNLDQRSFDLNFESDLIAYDDKITKEIRTQQMAYIARSRPVILSEIAGRGTLYKLRDNLVATLGPIL